MKYLNHIVAVSAAMSFSLLLAACGDDVTKITEITEVRQTTVAVVPSEGDLPECGENNNGTFSIAKDNNDVFVCYAKKWYVLNGNDGSTTKAKDGTSGKNGKNGTDGKDGSDGEDGVGCAGVPFESGDSSGFKIVCGKDTLGVILNGKDGSEGKSGKGGRVGVKVGLAKTLAKRMKRGINTDFFDNLSEFTGFNDAGLQDTGYYIKDGLNNTAYPNALKKTHFKTIADAGFDHVRLQVRWDHFKGDSSKCQIDPEYMKQIKWAVDNTIANGMIAVVDEHYLAFRQTEDNYHLSNGYSYSQISPCLKSIYRQIADSMAIYSTDSLIIELPNEPNFDDKITATQWTNLADSLIQVIHDEDPARVIIVGPRGYYNRMYLNELNSVIARNNGSGLLIASFHYYDPMPFTGSNGPGTWEASNGNKFTIYDAFSNVASWATSQNVPVYLGEFGVNNEVKDTEAVEKWLTTIVSAADYYGFAMAIHDFSGYFFTYNLGKKKWVDYKIRPLFNPKYDMSLDLSEYDLTKLTAIPLENFDGDYPDNDYLETSWNTNDTNVTEVTAELVTNGYDGKSFHGKFTVASPGEYPVFSLFINISGENKDWSSVKAISFYAKGSGMLKLALPTDGTNELAADYPDKWVGEFASEVELSLEWKRYVIWRDALIPEAFSQLDTLGAEWDDYDDAVNQFCFWRGSNLSPTSNATVEWFIDDIVIYRE